VCVCALRIRPISLSGYANGEIMTLEISDVSPDLLVLEVKDSNLPESIHGSLDMEMNADFHEDDDDDGHGKRRQQGYWVVG
jgi:hypothetical protein